MRETFKLYTDVKKISGEGTDSYYEVTYKEYDYDGNVVSNGVEDFNYSRLHSATRLWSVYVYNGWLTKSGGKRTDCIGSIRLNKGACAIKAARSLYRNVARVR